MKHKGRKLPTILTEEEVRKLLSVFNKRYISSYTNYLLIRIMVETGMRVSEVIGLTLENIDRNTGKTMIREGKGKKDRVVFLNMGLLECLNSYLERTKKGISGLVFTTRTGTSINQNNVNRMIETYRKKAGIEKHITAHTFRHTYATHLLNKTNNLSLVQKVLGHEYISTTQIYIHLCDKDVEKNMAIPLFSNI